jgi:hypothetical protein
LAAARTSWWCSLCSQPSLGPNPIPICAQELEIEFASEVHRRSPPPTPLCAVAVTASRSIQDRRPRSICTPGSNISVPASRAGFAKESLNSFVFTPEDLSS